MRGRGRVGLPGDLDEVAVVEAEFRRPERVDAAAQRRGDHAAAERAVSRGIELSERQIALIERWSGELQRAFPPDASESSADFTSEQSDGEDDDEEASFDAMERAMRDAFYPRTAGEHFAIT